eukprot:CAMPEP_0184033568 /NCGR_PEP_ID=MMETSP0955-20130417/3865_1 /TAXON_ID=627963 /ORGANISM="Aplanochytrium sp, Strain PBS07" /LENGTH=306 /DNA_ID=CAMNT_0026319987 /DNA_START=64 /DNA_END=984 /DNA_ORIENTATION=-
MTAFDANGKIKKYSSANVIMDEFFPIRLKGYEDRKQHLEETLENEWIRLDNKARFVTEAATGKISLLKRKKSDLENELEEKNYFSDPEKKFDYLLSMPVYNLTMEKVEEITKNRDLKRAELDDLRSKTPADLWNEDLDKFLVALDEQDEIDAKAESYEVMSNSTKPKKARKKRTKQPAKVKAEPSLKTEPKKKKAPKKAPEVVEEEILSLADRLKARMNVTPLPLKKKRSKEKTPKTSTVVKPKQKKTKQIEEDDDEVEEVVEPVVETKKSRSRRNAKKVVYVVSSDEGDDSEFDFEEDDDDDEDY